MSLPVGSTKNRRLTVCIAAYKEEHSLPSAVASVLASTIWSSREFDEKEILICVNGGDAGTERVARALEAAISAVRCSFIEENGKVLAVRRLISDSSRDAPVLFFLDADVLLESSALEQLYLCLCAYDTVEVAGAFAIAVEEPLRKCSFYQYGYARLITAPNTRTHASRSHLSPAVVTQLREMLRWRLRRGVPRTRESTTTRC